MPIDDEWIKMWYTYTVEYSLAIKRWKSCHLRQPGWALLCTLPPSAHSPGMVLWWVGGVPVYPGTFQEHLGTTLSERPGLVKGRDKLILHLKFIFFIKKKVSFNFVLLTCVRVRTVVLSQE